MRIVIAAVGRLKDEAERRLVDRYVERLRGRMAGIGPLRVEEIGEGKQATAAARREDEATRLLRSIRDADAHVGLDVSGKAMSSEAFAGFLGRERDRGTATLAFLVGGPDGHGAAALEDARMKLSLSAMTLPHGLARVILCEQIYRAMTILSGHPYHRA